MTPSIPLTDGAELPGDFATRAMVWANRIAREFRYSEGHDLLGEVWVYLLSHPQVVNSWYYEDTRNPDEPVTRFSWKASERDSTRIMAEAARRDKRKAIGTVEEDEFTYARAQIESLLPYVWHSEVLAAGQEQEGPRAPSDPAKGNNGPVMAMDMRRAWDRVAVPGSEWDFIGQHLYRFGSTQQEVADALGVDQPTIHRRNRALLDAIGYELNGTLGFNPAYRRKTDSLAPPEPGQTLGDGPGSRKAISNSTATRITE